MRRIILIAACVVIAPAVAHACLNDRDTLADEAQRFPNAVQVITGRFPRNPPLYYTMRIARESADLKAHPNTLGEYDDVAVGLDHLGRDDEALAVMARKLARMKSLKTPGNADNSGDTPWYRYDANTGTFLAHRTIRHPGKYPASDLQRGRDLIAEAIRVNPHAHFGREKVQLAVMDWMLGPADESSWSRLGDHIRHRMEEELKTGVPWSQVTSEWRSGLEGLVVLGGAWESPDIFGALYQVYAMSGSREMGGLAAYRGGEILEHGGRALMPDVRPHVYPPKPGDARWSTASNFLRLRKEAEAWHARRTAYMMERLTAGRHPDTDATFWADWRDPGPPALVDKPWPLKTVHHTGMEWWQFSLFLGVFAGLSVAFGRRWRSVGMKWDEAVLVCFIAFIVLLLMAAA
jgi:hypothetical protein